MARDGKVWQGMARASKYSASERLISVISVLSSSKANCQSLLAAQAERVAEQWKLFTSSWRLCLGLSKFQYKCGTYVVLTVDVFGIGVFFLILLLLLQLLLLLLTEPLGWNSFDPIIFGPCYMAQPASILFL
jgi:hypothetical protein